MKEKPTLIDTIRIRRCEMVGHSLRHAEELHNIILKGMIEGKKTAERPPNLYTGQTVNDARNKTFKEQIRGANQPTNQPSG